MSTQSVPLSGLIIHYPNLRLSRKMEEIGLFSPRLGIPKGSTPASVRWSEPEKKSLKKAMVGKSASKLMSIDFWDSQVL